MTETVFKSYDHYVADDTIWTEPKEFILQLIALLYEDRIDPEGELLDVGCAAGEAIHFIRQVLPDLKPTGTDLFPEFVATARARQPGVNFEVADALALPDAWADRFACTIALGVMSIFDETEIENFWRNLLKVTRPGGLIYVLAPLNEHGVDAMIRHRKRHGPHAGEWESKWNIHSVGTITDLLGSLRQLVRFEPFRISRPLAPRADALRTWTMATDTNPLQLTNGLKLLVDHYFMMVRKRVPIKGSR